MIYPKYRYLCLLIGLLLGLLSPVTSTASETDRVHFSTLPPGNIPVTVHVGLYVHDITNINERDEVARVNGTIRLRWQDSRLAFDEGRVGAPVKTYTGDAARTELNETWRPYVEFNSARAPRVVQSELLRIASDGIVTYTQQFELDVQTVINVRKFPFDKQKLFFSLQSLAYDRELVTLIPENEYEGVSVDAHLPEWDIKSYHSNTSEIKLPNFNRIYSHYQFVIDYERKPIFYVLKVLIPMFLIVMISWSGFWLTNESVAKRITLSISAILTLVAFQWLLFRTIPHTGYPTFIDLLIFFSFVWVSLTIVMLIYIHRLSVVDYRDHLEKIESYCRLYFPVGYLGLLLLLVIYFFIFT